MARMTYVSIINHAVIGALSITSCTAPLIACPAKLNYTLPVVEVPADDKSAEAATTSSSVISSLISGNQKVHDLHHTLCCA